MAWHFQQALYKFKLREGWFEALLTAMMSPGRPLPVVYWYVGDQLEEGRTQTEPGKDVVVNKLRYKMWVQQ